MDAPLRREFLSQQLAAVAGIGSLAGCLFTPETNNESNPQNGSEAADEDSATIWLRVRNGTDASGDVRITVSPADETDALETLELSMQPDTEESDEISVADKASYDVTVDAVDGPKRSILVDAGDLLEVRIGTDEIEYMIAAE